MLIAKCDMLCKCSFVKLRFQLFCCLKILFLILHSRIPANGIISRYPDGSLWQRVYDIYIINEYNWSITIYSPTSFVDIHGIEKNIIKYAYFFIQLI